VFSFLRETEREKEVKADREREREKERERERERERKRESEKARVSESERVSEKKEKNILVYTPAQILCYIRDASHRYKPVKLQQHFIIKLPPRPWI